ncbi:hypothetical protein IQ22_00946 [Pseudomonas duriflava]|uniref:Uncharacterized protein n=1 Tax=Pseudomonas duriflava TaxID=459528 RepID=A0A562QIB7_9PSED|nr:hypothetical protein [Pseudomonas duriflava]TWI56497.1 hypothetical protein IQ22_00946 [Pseudomonas duriflava]
MIKILSILLKPFEHDKPPATFDWLGDIEGRAEEPLHDKPVSAPASEKPGQQAPDPNEVVTRFKA